MKYKNNYLLIFYFLFLVLISIIEPIRNPTNTLYYLSVSTLLLTSYIAIIYSQQNVTFTKLVILYILTRIIIFPMQAWLSDDVFTYLWQGKLFAHGINVYEFMPLDIKLDIYRDLNSLRMGNLTVPAIYPPLSVIIFSLNYKLANIFSSNELLQFYTWKLILLLCEISTLLLLKFKLKVDNLKLILYILCPLPLIEIIGQGHNDALLLPVIAVLLLNFENKNNKLINSFLLTIGTLIKMVPIFCFPLIVFKDKLKYNTYNLILSILLLIVALIASYIIFFDSKVAISNYQLGMNYYNIRASFFSAPLETVKYVLQFANVANYWEIAPYIVYYSKFLGIIAISIFFFFKKNADKVDYITFILLASYLIANKVHTWYFVPIILLLTIKADRTLIIILSISILSYTKLRSNIEERICFI
ncbi:MAG TPA: hypothetical protein PLE30_08940 [Candidatus Kapabacteria bacterium]|nr:hypothetical protein [Candidatus Kapabacteria bacterium]